MNNHTPEIGLSFERVVFFSDAVFAIARLLDPTTKRSKQAPATANEEAAA